MTDSTRQRDRRQGVARLLTLCAVLLGLLLMHGAPANAAEGCHGAMPAPAALPAKHAGTAMASTSSSATHAAAQQASAMSAMGGAMCVSTPARDLTTLPVAGLMAVVAVLAVLPAVGRPVALGRTGRRGPPTPGGRSLLLQVCIART